MAVSCQFLASTRRRTIHTNRNAIGMNDKPARATAQWGAGAAGENTDLSSTGSTKTQARASVVSLAAAGRPLSHWIMVLLPLGIQTFGAHTHNVRMVSPPIS